MISVVVVVTGKAASSSRLAMVRRKPAAPAPPLRFGPTGAALHFGVPSGRRSPPALRDRRGLRRSKEPHHDRSSYALCRFRFSEAIPVIGPLTPDQRTRLRAAISALPEPGRSVYLLSARDGLEHSQIAQRLNLTVAEVRINLAQAVGDLFAVIGNDSSIQ